MKIVIDIPEEKFSIIKSKTYCGIYDADLYKGIENGTPLPKYMEELKRWLFMEVDGGTGDNYLRYADVCDRISNTIDTYINAESEVSDGDSN